MGEWKRCKLGDIIFFGNGKARPKEDGDIPVYGGNGILGYANKSNYDGETVIIGRVGAYCGATYYENRHIWISDNALAAKSKNDHNAEYLFYLLKNMDLNQHAGGSSHPLVTQTLLNSLDVEYADSKAEQKAIAGVLSSLDDKIDLLHRQNKTLESMTETLFRQWFVEEGGEDWEDGCLGDVADINPSYQLKKGDIAPYLEMSNINNLSFNPCDWYNRKFLSGMKFKNGDTLLARITPCLENGKTCFVMFLDDEEIGWGSTEYIVIRMKELFHPYISYIIAKDKDFRDFAISSMSGSSGRQRAQANVIKEYAMKIPSLEIIEKLNHQLSGILPKLKNNANQIRVLEKLRDTLLPKLMSGEVRVETL